MKTSKQICVGLRKRDHTLSEIVKITGLAKSTVHFHIQNLPLSRAKQLEISMATASRARHMAAKRRGISARHFKKFNHWNSGLVSLVSHLMFDGEIRKNGCIYNNRNVSLLNRVENYMKEIYTIAPKRYTDTVTGVSRISYYNVSLAEYIKEKSTELLHNIPLMPQSFKRTFLLSFFDDEGCIDYNWHRKHRRIRGYQKNVDVLNIVRELLRDFEIISRIQLPNEILIVGKVNLIKFQKEIGFSPGVRINGKRSNSIWKKSLEKREILRRAIASYKPVGSNGVHRTPQA